MTTARRRNDDDDDPANLDNDTTADTDETGDDVETTIDQWIEEDRSLAISSTAQLYKFDHPTQGKGKSYAGYFIGEEIPNRDGIGKRYGSGRFLMIITRPMKNKKRDRLYKTFRIHEIYDQIKKKIDTEAAEEDRRKLFPQGTGNGPATAAPMDTVKEILSLLLPIIRDTRAPLALPAPATENPDLMATYKMMQGILKTSLIDQAATYREIGRRFAGIYQNAGDIDENDEPEEKEREPGIMEKIISMIEPFFGLIARNDPAGKLAAASLKAAPQFAAVLSDTGLCRMIIQYFDKTKGKKAADVALSNIGIARARFFPPPTAAQPAAQPPAATPQQGKQQ